MDSNFPKQSHFCQLHRVHAERELTLDEDPIKVITETDSVCLFPDAKLSYLPHVKYLKTF